MPRLCSSLLLSLLIASAASAVTMDWTPIGNPGNACDHEVVRCPGSVSYLYSIGTYEITNAQYAEFLNAKAASDSLALYHPNMGGVDTIGGITQSGSSGSYTYAAIEGREQMPVNWVSFYDAARFANWINNGQGSGDTETGAYTLLGGTPTPSNGSTLTRNASAVVVLPSEDEWYKAAYYDPEPIFYFDPYFAYPAGFDTQTGCGHPTGQPNEANCAEEDLFDVGSYTGSPSPYGTFDQGGNVAEWTESDPSGLRLAHGGGFLDDASALRRDRVDPQNAGIGDILIGFRLAMIPEPGTGLLVIAGLLGLGGWRRGRA